MARWREISGADPVFAERIERAFGTGINKTIATIRRDGSPRISAIELEFVDGEVHLGMMKDSLKLKDVRRDPRVAIHSPTPDPPGGGSGTNDAKLAGVLVEVPPPEHDEFPGAGYFVLDIREAVLVYVGEPADHLVIESWHPDRGTTRRIRT